MVNWINGFKAGNKKEKYTRFRFMFLNMGFEI